MISLTIALLSCAFDAGAQGIDGEIQGVAVDLAGASLPGATVTIVNTETRASRIIRTDASGRFSVLAVPAGRYEVTVAAAGFAPRRQDHLRVQVGQAATLRFELRQAIAPETITIGDLPPAIDPTRADVATVIEEAAVTHLPVKSRNFLDLAPIAAGVTRDLATGDTLIAGQPSAASTISVDGGELVEFGPYTFSQEAIQEFRIDMNGYRAEYGRASGAVIHAITRSGTNAFHGSAIALRGGSTVTAPRDIDTHQLGGVVGGPIVRDRHFFLVNYDTLQRARPDRDQRVYLIRTDHQLTGDDRVTLRYNDQELGGGRATRSSVAAVTTVFGSRLVNDGRLHYLQARDVRAVNRLQVADTVTWAGGSHEIKTGFDAVGDDLSASMPFGTLANTAFSSENVSGFVQDEWQAGRAVTVNAGVRHDAGTFSEFGDWDPRLGLTWAPAARLVVRGSYGRFSSPGDLRVRQASAGAEYEWMPQTTIAVNYLQSDARGVEYRAVTGEAQRRFWQGTQYRAAYTFSNDASRHRFVASYVYDTGAFADRFSGVLTTLLKDWTASAVATVQSGDARLHTTRIGYLSFDPRIARNLSLGSGRTLAFILETYNLRNRPNVLAVNDAVFPLEVGQPEGRLTQIGLRLIF